MKLWKALNSKMCSNVGDLPPWQIGVWKKHSGKVEVYGSGFHASKNVIDALNSVPEVGYLCLVGVRGEHDNRYEEIEAWEEMQVTLALKWMKKDSVALAIYAAEIAIKIFETTFPFDDRPRRAIEAAKAWLENPSEKNRQEAEKAGEEANATAWMISSINFSQYDSEYHAVLAARDAARAAGSKKSALEYALNAELATELAFANFMAAEGTVEMWDKVRRRIRDKCHEFVLKRLNIKALEKI